MFILIIIPLVAAVVSACMPRERQRIIEYEAIFVSLIEALVALALAISVVQYGTLAGPAIFTIDALSAFSLCFVTVVGVAAAIHSVGHLREEMQKGIIGFRRIRQYFVLFHLYFFALFMALVTGNPLVTWISIETTTLATAFLITFYNKPSALEAGWKHLVINTTGLLIGLFGTLLFLSMAAQAGSTQAFVSWDALASLAPVFNHTLVAIAFIFVIVGYGTKVGLVPMHTWLPDAHSKAPVPISGLLSGLLLNVALIAILRFRTVTDLVLDPSFSAGLLLAFGMLSITVAAFIILVQKNYKRMLAYSSIEHMGIIALGFALGGAASVAALLHMLYHALLKPLLFFSSGNIFLKYSSTKMIQVRGCLSLLPVSAPVFLAALLALTAVPPSGIFFTKLTILAAGMHEYPYLMLFALAVFVVVFVGFVRHASDMLFGEAPAHLAKGEFNGFTIVSLALLAAVFITLSMYIPGTLMVLVTRAAAIINGTI